MDRTSGILRQIRRQWSPYRVYAEIYNDNIFAEDINARTATTVAALDRLYFWLDDPTTTEAADAYGSAFPNVGRFDFETHRMYALFQDPNRLDARGERIWDGSTLCVQTWSLASWLMSGPESFVIDGVTYATGSDNGPYHETYTLTGGRDGAQTLFAEFQLRGSSMEVNQQVYGRPWLNGQGVSLATVVRATGTWKDATDLRIAASDRPDREENEFMVDVWRGYGGERIRHPVRTFG